MARIRFKDLFTLANKQQTSLTKLKKKRIGNYLIDYKIQNIKINNILFLIDMRDF